MDLSLESLVTLVQLNDEEVLCSSTLWSDQVMEAAKNTCNGGIDIPAVLMALRIEAVKRGIKGC
jgi:heterodisulfide reductase subunit C